MTFYMCPACNQVHIKLIDTNQEMICCGIPEQAIIENCIEEEVNNHLPSIRKVGNFITISVPHNHPMVDIHHILFIAIETNEGIQVKYIKKDEPAQAGFILSNHEYIIKAYVFCNVHLLFSTDNKL
jgi:superoxide reductase